MISQLSIPAPSSGLGAIRAMRARTRRHLHEPRPQISPEIKKRIGIWKARVEAAQKAGLISKGCHLYLLNLLTIASVARGQWCLYSDESMGERINCSGRTVRRHRHEAINGKEGVPLNLVESLDGRKRHQTCMVRPMLDDGPVFSTPDRPTNTGQPARPKVADELPSTRSYSERTPQPPVEQDNAPKQSGQALVAPDLVSKEPTPAKPPERIGQGLGDDAVAPPEPITFSQFWAATDKGGAESAAAAAWDRLSGADKAAIAAAIRREGRLQTGTSYVGVWLQKRRWPTLSAPKAKEEVGFRVEADADNGLAWRRYWAKHQQRGWPVGRDGYFVRNLPTLWPPEQ
jgi:hypothetical protein